ncbi:hypothetical protein OF83DRAFT_1173948 [Amylostereum chailletii]|nr:hypothetical protein OF83DRAFT_1173948 [Amylostereum chailletii]
MSSTPAPSSSSTLALSSPSMPAHLALSRPGSMSPSMAMSPSPPMPRRPQPPTPVTPPSSTHAFPSPQRPRRQGFSPCRPQHLHLRRLNARVLPHHAQPRCPHHPAVPSVPSLAHNNSLDTLNTNAPVVFDACTPIIILNARAPATPTLMRSSPPTPPNAVADTLITSNVHHCAFVTINDSTPMHSPPTTTAPRLP